MNTLIVYDSKHGATRQACGELAGRLRGQVTLVDLGAGETAGPEGFDWVLVGGPIYAGSLRSGVKGYLDTHREVLLKKDLGLFLCGADQTQEHRENFLANNVPEDLLVHARVRGHFGHQFHFDRMNFLERTIVKKIVKVRGSEDKVDLEGIERFAQMVDQDDEGGGSGA